MLPPPPHPPLQALKSCVIPNCGCATGGFKVRRQRGGEHGALFRDQASVAHQPDLMQPTPAPLQRSVGKCDSGLERNQSCRLLPQSRAIGLAVKGTTISTAGIEADEPILPEVERFVFHGGKAKHAEPGPQKPARSRLPDDAVKVLGSERREWIVDSGRKDVMVNESECFRFACPYDILPSPIENDPMGSARRVSGPRIWGDPKISSTRPDRDAANLVRNLVRRGVVYDYMKGVWNVMAQQASLPQHQLRIAKRDRDQQFAPADRLRHSSRIAGGGRAASVGAVDQVVTRGLDGLGQGAQTAPIGYGKLVQGFRHADRTVPPAGCVRSTAAEY